MNDRVASIDSWSDLFGSKAVSAFFAPLVCGWLHAANSMLAATTLPSAVSELGGAHLISWAFTLYLLGSILAGASAGLLSQRFSLRTGLVGSAILYGIGSGVCAIAWHMEIVLTGRLLQGLGGGSLLAMSYMHLPVSSRCIDAKADGGGSATWSVSAFCGPVIGGTFSTVGPVALWVLGVCRPSQWVRDLGRF